MSKELDYIADLERKNRTLKSILYCTKRSCNNCGKVNCENFQRQRIDCCGLWVSYKDYIKQQEEQIESQKKEITQAHIDGYNRGYAKANKELETENNKLLDVINNQDVKIADLEKENAELKETLKTYNGCGDWDNDFHACRVYLQHEELQMYINQLSKAKEIIKTLSDDLSMYSGNYQKELLEAKQFLKEIEN